MIGKGGRAELVGWKPRPPAACAAFCVGSKGKPGAARGRTSQNVATIAIHRGGSPGTRLGQCEQPVSQLLVGGGGRVVGMSTAKLWSPLVAN